MLATTIWAVLVAQSLAKDLVPYGHQQIHNENAGNSGRLAYFDAKRLPNRHYKINFIYEQRKTNEITEIERIEEEIGKYMHHQSPSTTTTTTEAQQNIEVVNEKETKDTTNHRPPEPAANELENHHHKHEEKQIPEIEQIEDKVRKHHHPSTTKSPKEAQQNIEVVNEKDQKETTTHRTSESPIIEQEKHHHKDEEKQLTEIKRIKEEILKYMNYYHPSTTKSTTEAQQDIEVANQKDLKEITAHRPSESPIIEQEKHNHKHEGKKNTEIEKIEDEIRRYMHHHHPSTAKSTTEAEQNIEVANQKDLKETTNHSTSESPIIEQEKHHHKHEETKITEIEKIEDEIRKYMHHHHPSTIKSTTEAEQNVEVENQKDIKETTPHRPSESPLIDQENHHHEHEEKKITEIKKIEDEIRKYMHHHRPSTTKSTTEAEQNVQVENQKDIKETTPHRPSESPLIAQENHHKHEEKGATEIEQIEDEIVKYKHYYHPSTMTTTTEAQYDIEVFNKKDFNDSTNANTSETPVTEPETHEEKEAISTLPPPPKLREPFIGFHPHFPLSGRRPIPHRRPDHRIHIARTTSEAPVEDARTELSPSVTQTDIITTNNFGGSQLDRQVLGDHKSKPFPHGHPYNRLHTSHAASKAPVEEEKQTELSLPVTQPDEMREITNYDDARYQLDGQDLRAYTPKPFPHRHPNNRRLHISHPALETPVEEETQTELSPPVTQSLSDEMSETSNYEGAGSKVDRQDISAFEPMPKPYRHPNHRLHLSRTTSEAPLELETQPDLFPSVKQLQEMDVAPNREVAESHLNRSDSLLFEPKPIPHRNPVWLHTSRKTSATSIEEEALTDSFPHVTQSDEKTTYEIAGSHLDRSNSASHEPKAILRIQPKLRLHISSTTSEDSVEEEVRTVSSPPVTKSDEMKDMNYIVAGSYLDRPDSSSHQSDHRLHVSRISSEASVEEETRTDTQPDEMEDNMYLDSDGAGSPDHRDFLTYEPKPISHGHPDYRLHVSRTTSESPVEVKARTNNASTDKRIHLSQTLENPSFRHKDRHTFANIRPKLNDLHGSIGLAPRPVYRGSYKFSLDDIYDMHSSTAPKVSQLKENPTPPPVPTLSPWYDGYGK